MFCVVSREGNFLTFRATVSS